MNSIEINDIAFFCLTFYNSVTNTFKMVSIKEIKNFLFGEISQILKKKKVNEITKRKIRSAIM